MDAVLEKGGLSMFEPPKPLGAPTQRQQYPFWAR
jgi:hypothetical protein